MEVTKTYIVQYRGNMHPLYECSVKGEGVCRYYIKKANSQSPEEPDGLEQITWDAVRRLIDKTLEAIACGSDGA